MEQDEQTLLLIAQNLRTAHFSSNTADQKVSESQLTQISNSNPELFLQCLIAIIQNSVEGDFLNRRLLTHSCYFLQEQT